MVSTSARFRIATCAMRLLIVWRGARDHQRRHGALVPLNHHNEIKQNGQ